MMIEFESVCLSFKNKDIFNNFNLTISENANILILGKSGIGKTSLFKLLLGFCKTDSGKIYFNGYKIDKTHIKKIREQIFYLSQDIDLREGIIGDLFDEIFHANSINHENSHQLEKILNFFELPVQILKQNVKKLSGGERQRIGLIIGFMLNRPVWLLDEPTSALDDVMKQKIADYILDQEKTIIIISHNDVWKQHKNIKIKRLGKNGRSGS